MANMTNVYNNNYEKDGSCQLFFIPLNKLWKQKKSAEIIQNAELLFKIIKVISFYFSPRIIAHNYQEAAAASTAAPTAAAPTAAWRRQRPAPILY